MTEKRNAPVRILHWGMLGGRGGIEMFIMNLYRQIDRSLVQFDSPFIEMENRFFVTTAFSGVRNRPIIT